MSYFAWFELLKLFVPCLGWSQGKQNSTNESTNGKLNNNTGSVETPKKDDEKQGDSPKEDGQRIETPKRESEPRLEMPNMDEDISSVERSIKDLDRQEDQLEEIKLDWRPLTGLHQCC